MSNYLIAQTIIRESCAAVVADPAIGMVEVQKLADLGLDTRERIDGFRANLIAAAMTNICQLRPDLTEDRLDEVRDRLASALTLEPETGLPNVAGEISRVLDDLPFEQAAETPEDNPDFTEAEGETEYENGEGETDSAGESREESTLEYLPGDINTDLIP